MTAAWRCQGGWVRLAAWEKRFAVFAAVSTRSLGNMKDVAVFRRRLGAAGLDPDRWGGGQQVHGGRVVPLARPRTQEKGRTDGVVTQTPGLTLRVFSADCVPVYLFDPVRRVIGLVHAGWRGVQKNIVPTAIRLLVRRYHSRPDQVWVAFGPHIARCCYAVGPEVAAVFQRTSGALSGFKGAGDRGDRRMLNLSAVLRSQLLGVGVRRGNITGAPGCTVCDRKFYSYRRDKTDQRQAAVFCLKGARASDGDGQKRRRSPWVGIETGAGKSPTLRGKT